MVTCTHTHAHAHTIFFTGRFVIPAKAGIPSMTTNSLGSKPQSFPGVFVIPMESGDRVPESEIVLGVPGSFRVVLRDPGLRRDDKSSGKKNGVSVSVSVSAGYHPLAYIVQSCPFSSIHFVMVARAKSLVYWVINSRYFAGLMLPR